MQFLKQSTAASVIVGPVLDADGNAFTSAVIGDFNVTKNGTTAALAAAATATHSHNGHYVIALTTGNTDTLGRLAISMNRATYAMTIFRYDVLTANQFDAIVTNGNVTPAAIADAVWSAAFSAYSSATGTMGLIMHAFSHMIEFVSSWRWKAAALSQAPAGGGSGVVNVLPAVGISAERQAGVVLSPFVGETITQSITLYQTDGTTPINLNGKSLEIVFQTRSGTDVAVIANANITVSGTGSNIVTFAYPAAVTTAERTLRVSLRDNAAPRTVYLSGLCKVSIAPSVDA